VERDEHQGSFRKTGTMRTLVANGNWFLGCPSTGAQVPPFTAESRAVGGCGRGCPSCCGGPGITPGKFF